MLNSILQVNNVSKHYKDFTALNDVSLYIKQGEIFGLIGENGAGKTTLMRIIAGCSKSTHGAVTILNKSGDALEQARKHMGVIIENPAYYGDMTAYDNLEIMRLAKGIDDKMTVSKSLEAVGLLNFATRRVDKFSLGMRQRLGLAMALIGSPKFIILDEPTNGLDPNGIVDMRNTILRLNKDFGISFLISSHILTELHQVATRYGIFKKGRLIAQHTSQELENQCQKQYVIKHNSITNDIITFISQYNAEVLSFNTDTIIFTSEKIIPKSFLKTLTDNGYDIIEFHSRQETLEDYFVRLTKEGDGVINV